MGRNAKQRFVRVPAPDAPVLASLDADDPTFAQPGRPQLAPVDADAPKLAAPAPNLTPAEHEIDAG